jgi:predicted lactoylglutathione lyase
VKDLGRSIGFFTTPGFSFNPQFTDENAGCLVISDDIYAMLLVEAFFKSFTKKDIADATMSTETILSLGVESGQRVDEPVDRAPRGGRTVLQRPGLHVRAQLPGPDGHQREVMYMDPTAGHQ